MLGLGDFVFAFVWYFHCFAHSYLRGDQDSVRQCPEANHVTWLGKKQSFVLRKIQAEQLSGLEVERSIFAINIHRAAEFCLFFLLGNLKQRVSCRIIEVHILSLALCYLGPWSDTESPCFTAMLCNSLSLYEVKCFNIKHLGFLFFVLIKGLLGENKWSVLSRKSVWMKVPEASNSMKQWKVNQSTT